MQLHPHAVDGCVGVQHLLFDTLIFIENHQIGSALMIRQSIGNARHFVAERAVKCEEMVDL